MRVDRKRFRGNVPVEEELSISRDRGRVDAVQVNRPRAVAGGRRACQRRTPAAARRRAYRKRKAATTAITPVKTTPPVPIISAPSLIP